MHHYTYLPVSIKTIHLIRPKLDTYYLAVEMPAKPEVQQKINTIIFDTVNALNKEQGYGENPMTEVTGTYELKVNERGALSISIINYAFSGGAHGLTRVKSLTFDTTTGKLYDLKELFKPDADYMKVISDFVKEQINEREIPTLEPFNAIKPNQDYYIGDKDLVVYFQQYELAPYAYGFPDFPITVYQIQEIIDENSPLGKMLSTF